jgi:hypothetical protein
VNLLHGATNLDEYAFALGALEHYTADNCGHPYINKAAAMYFPKLRAKFGDRVTYEDSPKAHMRTEFGFDVTQVAKQRYTTDSYLARLLGWIERVMPKVGFLNALAFKTPTPETEDLYLRSVNKTVATYRRLLREAGEGNLHLEDTNLDTGRPAEVGEYALSDEAYAQLLEALVKRGLEGIPPDVRTDILSFFDNTTGERRTLKQKKMWARVKVELEALREGPNSPIAREVRQQLLAPPRRLESPKAKDA